MNSRSKWFGFLVLGLALFFSRPLPAHAAYVMQDLGVLPGGTYSVATAINKSGLIVGYGDTLVGTTLRTHAFSYSGGQMKDLGTVAGWLWSKAYAVNDAGQIVGQGGTELPKYPFLYSAGVMTQIAPPPALESGSVAYGINADHIVGYGNWINNTYNDHAFSYAIAGGGVLDLGTLDGIYSTAYAINRLGLIVGQADTLAYQTFAFLYDGQMNNLGGLGGFRNQWASCAYAINAAGLIVGGAITDTAEKFQHAVWWDAGGIHDLGANGQNESCATGINSAGQIVGWYGNGVFGRGFVWTNGKMQDIGDLAAKPQSFNTFANGINDAGWIVGQSKTKIGDIHAFLAMPLAISAPFALLLLD